MNKKGLVFKKAFFALIVMSLSIIAIGVWVNDWNTQYDSGLTYDLGDYESLDEMSAQASAQRGNVSIKSSFDAGSGAANFEGTSLRGVFSIVNNLFAPFEVVFGDGGMLNSVEERWGLPNYIVRGTIAFMLIAITFALIALLFRSQRSEK